MSRLCVFLAIIMAPATSFGQGWFQSSGRTELDLMQTSTLAGSGLYSPQSTLSDLRSVQGGVSAGWASESFLDRSKLGHQPPHTTLANSQSMLRRISDQPLPGLAPSALAFDDVGDLLVRGQSPADGGGSGGGAGAAEATDPSQPLTQLQLQNIFTPETYDASGYSNTFIVQPVLPFNIGEDAFFPYHIMRPTIPIIAPTADPDGPRGVQGGLGDTTIVDAFFHPMKELKTNVGVGYVATLPTRTHPSLGRGEWQLGPSVAVISRIIPKWVVGGLVEVPFSLSSDAYQVQMQAIALRLLPNEWFIGWGDQILKFDDQNGGYDIPLSMQLGKVIKVGDTPMKLFVQPIYTPEGLRSGPGGTEWAIKFNLTILFPNTKLDAPFLSGCASPRGRNCDQWLP